MARFGSSTSGSPGLGTLAGLRLETALDGADGTLGSTLFAGDEEDAVLLCELGFWTLASLADDVFGDVSSEDVLDLLGLETAADDETLGAVDGADGSQLGKEELDDVLGLTVHTLADVDDVGKDGLFGAVSGDLRRDHGELFLVAGEGGVLGAEGLEYATEELLICVVAVCALPCLDRVVLGGCVCVVCCVLGKGVVSELLVVGFGICVVGGGLCVVGLVVGLSDLLFESVEVERDLLLGLLLLLELAKLG